MNVELAVVRELETSARWLAILCVIACSVGALLFFPGVGMLFTPGRPGLKILLILGGALYIATAFMMHRYRTALERVIERPNRAELATSMFEHSLFWRIQVFFVIAAFVVTVMAFVAALAGPVLGAIRGEAAMRTTQTNMETIGAALEEYARDHSEYPRAATMRDLERALVPKYAKAIVTADGWKRPLIYRTRDTDGGGCFQYRLISVGEDGVDQTGATLFEDRFTQTAISSPAEARKLLAGDDLVFGEGAFMATPPPEKKP